MNIEQAHKKIIETINVLRSNNIDSTWIKNNKNYFLDFFQQLAQNYNYIKRNAKSSDFYYIDSYSMLLELEETNPALKGFIEIIIGNRKLKTDDKSKEIKSEEFDKSSLIRRVESTISEIKDINGIDTEKIDDYIWQLEKYKNELQENKKYFSDTEYNNLLEEIDKVLMFYERYKLYEEEHPQFRV